MSRPDRSTLLAWTALVAALAALVLAGWSAVVSMRTREDIRQLGEILTRGAGALRMSMDPPPPTFDPDDR